MATMTIPEAAAYLAARDHFSIATHRRPDGDTLGTAALLCRGLRQLGKTAHVLENPEITPKYAFLNEGLTKPAAEAGDTIVSVDVATTGMLPAALSYLAGKVNLRIDHHRNEDPQAENEVVNPISASCGQIVYQILQEMGATLDIPMANALYTAVATDTGCFRFSNAQAETYLTAADCAKVTPYLRELNHALFGTVSLNRLRIQGYMTEHAEFLENGRICICTIPLSVEKEMGITEDDMENISGFPRSIEGVQLACTFRENEDGNVKLSVRCLPEYDASAICAKFGGGGHMGAAGANMGMPMAEAVAAIKAVLPPIDYSLEHKKING